MRKTLLLLLVPFLALWFAERPAQAIILQGGYDFSAHLIDASSVYVDTDTDPATPLVPRAPQAFQLPGYETYPSPPWAFTIPDLGDELRVVYNIDSWFPPAQEFMGDSFGHLTGLLYNLTLAYQDVSTVGTITTFDLYFTGGIRNPVASLIPGHNPAGSGGVLELWLDTTPENGATTGNSMVREDGEALFDPAGDGLAPFYWDEASGPGPLGHAVATDGYPTVNNIPGWADDSTLWLQGMLAPLFSLDDGTPIVWVEHIITNSASPTSILYNYGTVSTALMTLTGYGSAFQQFVLDRYGPGWDVVLSANLRLPENPQYVGTPQDEGNWAVSSWDPASGAIIIPEPATMTLLGLSLVGLGGAFFRRRRK
jgi:hypothetical protein